MKKTKEHTDSISDDLLQEYQIDYSKVKRNPYFRDNRTFIEIDADILKTFQSSDNINEVLRAISKSFKKGSAVAV